MREPPITSLPSVADVDAVWLTSVLRTAGVAGDSTVTEVAATSIGTGQVGESTRFVLTWDSDDAGLPPSVVGKFPSMSEVSRATAVQVGTYQREIGFYRDLRDRVDVRTPQIHHLGWDAESHDFVLIMEDLRDYEPGDQLAGCTVARARAAAEEIVGLHAPTWGRAIELERDWLQRPSADRTGVLAAMYAATLPGFVDRYGDRLGGDVVAVAHRAVEAYPSIAAGIAAWATGPGAWCVAHGDYRLDNLLFAVTSGTPPVVVVDWQTTSIGVGPADVAYVVGSGLLPDVRRAHEHAIVAAYGGAMRGRGAALDDTAAWDGYVLGSAGGLLMAILASQIVERTERGDLMFMAMAARHAVMVDDLGLLDRL